MFVRRFIVLFILILLHAPISHAAPFLNNGISSESPGYLRVNIDDAGDIAVNGLTAGYRRADGSFVRRTVLIGGEPFIGSLKRGSRNFGRQLSLRGTGHRITREIYLASPTEARSEGQFNSDNGVVTWRAFSTLPANGSTLTTTIEFSSSAPFGELEYFHYISPQLLEDEQVLAIRDSAQSDRQRFFLSNFIEGTGMEFSLTQSSLRGIRYDGWAADQSGNSNTLKLNMSLPKTGVSGRFPPTFTKTGNLLANFTSSNDPRFQGLRILRNNARGGINFATRFTFIPTDRSASITYRLTVPSAAVTVMIDPPINVRASDGTVDEHVEIGWEDPSNLGLNYQVYRSRSQNEVGTIVSGGRFINRTTFIDTGADPGIVYYYRVKSLASYAFGDVESGFSSDDSGFRPASFRLTTPVHTKFNTFLKQRNFLELISAGPKGFDVGIKIFNRRGKVINQTRIFLAAQSEFDFNINDFLKQGCSRNPGRCSDLSDIDQSGDVDTYGLVRLDFDDSDPEKILLGRISNYKQNADGKTFSFAIARELRNPIHGPTYSTGNTLDPQGRGYLVPNWAEIINLDTRSHKRFRYNLYDQDGTRVFSQIVTLAPLGEFDVHAGHEIRQADGTIAQGVYLAEVIPSDPDADYLFSVSRYSSNETYSLEAEFAFATTLDARAGAIETLYAGINDQGRLEDCATPSNWLEVVNISDRATRATIVFKDSAGNIIDATDEIIAGKGQKHFFASAIIPNGSIGVAEIQSEHAGTLIAQSMVYMHDCERNDIRTGYTLPAMIASRDGITGTVNTFLGIEDELLVLSTRNESFRASYDLISFDGSRRADSLNFNARGGAKQTVLNGPRALSSFPANTYGIISIDTPGDGYLSGFVLRKRSVSIGGRNKLDFIMPTVLR